MELKRPRVLIYDIETSLQPVAVFQLANNDWIHPENILGERHVLSVCWKWLGESKVHAVSILDDPKRFAKDPHDDVHVLQTFHQVLGEADCIVAHNGDSFDKRYLDTRFLVKGLSPLPPIASIDTYKIAKSRLMLNSNKLDYLGGLLGVGRKKHTTSGLWLKALQGDKRAIKEMVEYNKQDVLLLERVFLKLRPFAANHINRELFGGTGCPRCGSTKIQSRGLHRAIARIYRRWQCQSCSGWFKSTKAEPGSSKFRIL
jgi:hypothetical protein